MSLRQTVQKILNKGLKPFSAQLVPMVEKTPPLLINGMNKSVAQKFFWFWAFLETKNLKGNIAEFGVGKGSGLAYWMNLKKQFNDNSTVLAFDSFQGFPNGTKGKDGDWFVDGNAREGYKELTVSCVKSFLINAGFDTTAQNEIEFIQGFIPESLNGLEPSPLKLVNLDLDLYQSTKNGLTFVWDHIVPGGMIILDEYDVGRDLEKWPGSKLAIDEFCRSQGLKLQRHFTGRVFLKK